MHAPSQVSPAAVGRRRTPPAGGFTLFEVTFAASIMLFVIATSLAALYYCFQMVDNARYTTLAGQILQSQMEKLRLLTWSQLTNATYGPGAPGNSTFTPDVSASTIELNHFQGSYGSCSQTLSDAGAPFTGTMKTITLTATWTDSFGRRHSLSYFTNYAQNGISDFFYTTH